LTNIILITDFVSLSLHSLAPLLQICISKYIILYLRLEKNLTLSDLTHSQDISDTKGWQNKEHGVPGHVKHFLRDKLLPVYVEGTTVCH